jgi:hypothetical protein
MSTKRSKYVVGGSYSPAHSTTQLRKLKQKDLQLKDTLGNEACQNTAYPVRAYMTARGTECCDTYGFLPGGGSALLCYRVQ